MEEEDYVPENPNAVSKYKTRGTQNEFEILKMVIQENRTIYLKVIQKLRQIKATRGLTAFDEMKKDQDDRIKQVRDRAKMK